MNDLAAVVSASEKLLMFSPEMRGRESPADQVAAGIGAAIGVMLSSEQLVVFDRALKGVESPETVALDMLALLREWFPTRASVEAALFDGLHGDAALDALAVERHLTAGEYASVRGAAVEIWSDAVWKMLSS